MKKIVSKPDSVDLQFEDLKLTPNQMTDLIRWQQNGDEVRVNIEQIQGNLLPTDSDEKVNS